MQLEPVVFQADARRNKEAYLKWLRRIEFNDPYAVTLTLKQAITNEHGRHVLTADRASQNMRHFLNLLSKALLGASKTKHLRRFVVLEGDDVTRPHFHLKLDKPSHWKPSEFAAQVLIAWYKTDWGYDLAEIGPCDLRWDAYLLKLRSKYEYDMSIDVLNSHF